MSRPTALDVREPGQRSPKLRVGLLVDGVTSNKYVFELTQWASEQDALDFSHLLIIRRPILTFKQKLARIFKRGFYGALSDIFFKLVVKLEQILIKQSAVHHDHLAAFHLDRLVTHRLEITPLVSQSEFGYRFSADDIDAVRRLELDLLIRCGSGILFGGILEAARLGVISFHHADNRVNRGGPTGFWEVFHRSEKTGFILQKLTEELDGGMVLKRGAFTTQFFWLLNQAHSYKKSNEHLKDLLTSIAASGNLPGAEEYLPYSARLYRSPQLHEAVVYVCKIVYRIAMKVSRRAVGLRERWSVSFIHTGWRNAVFVRSHRIPNPRGRYLADPFLYRRDGRTFCFVEEYVYRTAKGHISAYEIRDHDAVELGPCLVEPFHLSFPYVFEYRGELYMCPEASGSNQIRVYRCKAFPLKWELHGVLMSDLRAADTMLFEHNRRWWMLTNIDKSDTGDHCAELYLFHADSPLSERWTAHPLNPIHIDSEIARNAGLFVDNGKLFRAAQRQGFDTYGKGLWIFEITALTETAYVENRIASIEPDFKPRLRGTHHISTTGTTTAIDHMSISFVR